MNDAGNQPDFTGQTQKKDHFMARQATGRTRFIATVPAIGLFIASIALAIGTLIELCLDTVDFVSDELSLHDLAVAYVEHADLFLLAVALYILSLGLVCLFITDKVPLPKWLEFHDFDDLKERLTGVIIVMIGVYFLGTVLSGASGIDVLWLGLSCAAIIVALSVFMRSVLKR